MNSPALPDMQPRELRVGNIARSLREGRTSASLLIQATLERIRRENPRLNAFTEIYEENALQAADRLDAAIAAGNDPGPLAGVPVAVKDLTPLEGKRTTLGSLVYRDRTGTFDPVYVQRLRRAGAIVVGKTNIPEFAQSGFCGNRIFGVTRNPWNTEHTPGGSSGGAAAAVSAGLVSLAEGTDMGGSVRLPAAHCGVVGLKPSLGRIPMDILPSVFDTISHFGPIASCVEDVWHFLVATKGPDEVDPFSLPAQTIPYDEDAGVEGLRIALSTDLGFYAVDEDVKDGLLRAADALRNQGASVDPVSLPWDHAIFQATRDNWIVFMGAFHGHLLDGYREMLDPENVEMLERAAHIDAVAYKRIELVRTRIWRDLVALFRHHDALLCPTVPRTAPLATDSDRNYGYRDVNGRTVATQMTAPFNLVPHCPALSVPSGIGEGELPTAAQIVGRRFDEATVLRVGRAIERTDPLKGVRPGAF